MEQTVEQKLKALYELQTLHTKIDKIRQIRGELPMEVADLEDEVAGLETRIQKIHIIHFLWQPTNHTCTNTI